MSEKGRQVILANPEGEQALAAANRKLIPHRQERICATFTRACGEDEPAAVGAHV